MATVSGVTRIPVSVDLLSRRSLGGAIVVVAVMLVYLVGFPVVYHYVASSGFAPGEPFVAFEPDPELGSPGVQITPADGWALDIEGSNDFIVKIVKGAADIQLIIPGSASLTPMETMESTILAYQSSSDVHWVVGEPRTFVTDAGVHGATLIAHSVNQAQQNWSIADDEFSATMVVTTPDNEWSGFTDEVDAVARSLRILPPGEGS